MSDGSKLEYLAPRPKSMSIEEKKAGYLPEPSAPITLENNFYDEVNQNSSRSWHKLTEAVKKNPFVPLGCLVTVGVLANGILAMRSKDRLKSQRMMRYRIAAQGSTIIALVVGTMASNYFAKSE